MGCRSCEIIAADKESMKTNNGSCFVSLANIFSNSNPFGFVSPEKVRML